MSNELKMLQSGLKLLEQKHYSEAVNLLEKYCQISEATSQTQSKEYLQGQMGLAKAYYCLGKQEEARIICQKLAASNNPQVQAWAQKILSSLYSHSSVTSSTQPQVNSVVESSVTPSTQPQVNPITTNKSSLTPEQAVELLNAGNKALKYKRYADAVKSLEEFYQGTDEKTQNYYQGLMLLVKAYKGNEQQDLAIALCQQLTTSNNEVANIWANKFISTLLPESAVVSTPSTTDVVNQETTVSESGQTVVNKVEMRTLNEFKNFCKEYLWEDLKYFENLRKQSLISVVVVSIIVAIVLLAVISLFVIQIISFLIIKVSIPLLYIFLFILLFWGSIWVWIAWYASSMETYTKEFKTKINQKIVDFINTNGTFRYSNYSSERDIEYAWDVFSNSQIFHGLSIPNKLRQYEWISGQVNEATIFLGEINTEVEIQHGWAKYLNFMEQWRILRVYQVPRYIARSIIFLLTPLHIVVLMFKFGKGFPYIINKIFKGRNLLYKDFNEEVLINEVSRKSVFKGFLFQADLPKKFIGKTIVLSKILKPSKSQTFNPQKVQLIKIKDTEFTKFFTVYGNNQDAAQNILSTNLMAKLIKLRKQTGKNVYVSFLGNMLYIGIEYGEDVFEPNLFRSMLTIAPLQEYFENIQLMLEIVEDFTQME